MRKLFSMNKAAVRLGIERKTITNYQRRGILEPEFTDGAALFFTEEFLQEFALKLADPEFRRLHKIRQSSPKRAAVRAKKQLPQIAMPTV